MTDTSLYIYIWKNKFVPVFKHMVCVTIPTINVFVPRENNVFAPSTLQRSTRGTMPTYIVFAVSFVSALFNYVAYLLTYLLTYVLHGAQSFLRS